MSKPVVFMFPGQGSNSDGMGSDLFRDSPVFCNAMLKVDSIVENQAGYSIVECLYGDKKNKKTTSRDSVIYNSVSLFMVEYSLVQVLLEKGIKPDYVLGMSMGEIVSSVIAEVIGIEEALELIIKQVDIFEDQCPRGGMLAILNDPNIYYEHAVLYKNSELSAINCSEHFTVSGDNEGLKKIELFLKENKIAYQDLNVSYAFHSSHIDPVKSRYLNLFTEKSYKDPTVPFISCTNTGIMSSLSGDYFWEVARKPMRFRRIIGELEEKGEYIYLDLGPTGTLALFVRNNLSKKSKSKSFSIMNLFGSSLKNLETIERYFIAEKMINPHKTTGKKKSSRPRSF
ncbi:MAG: acyltransferase domain-containing protein [bacterium]|nr:acyltransferase domain-containing protein [bacterium]